MSTTINLDVNIGPYGPELTWHFGKISVKIPYNVDVTQSPSKQTQVHMKLR